MHYRVVYLLFAAGLLANGYVRADGPPELRSPARLILRQVKMQNADLSTALQSLSQEAEKQSGGMVKVSFTLELPKDFKPSCELTLELHTLPFFDALRCVGDLAGVDFFMQGNAIVVRAKRVAPVALTAQSTPATTTMSPQASVPTKGLTGALGAPPERVGVGDARSHRAMDGSVQPEQSGYVAHRALDGWSTEMKQKHVFDANCIHVAQCPNGCGCAMCSCQKTSKK